MSKRVHVVGWSLLAAMSFGLAHTMVHAAENAEGAKPKHTIKEVMKCAHVAPEGGKSLLAKVIAGDASADEKNLLLDVYISMVENEPPKGEMSSWHRLAGRAALAAGKVVVGREGAADELKQATNCAACHKEHKPPAQ